MVHRGVELVFADSLLSVFKCFISIDGAVEPPACCLGCRTLVEWKRFCLSVTMPVAAVSSSVSMTPRPPNLSANEIKKQVMETSNWCTGISQMCHGNTFLLHVFLSHQRFFFLKTILDRKQDRNQIYCKVFVLPSSSLHWCTSLQFKRFQGQKSFVRYNFYNIIISAHPTQTLRSVDSGLVSLCYTLLKVQKDLGVKGPILYEAEPICVSQWSPREENPPSFPHFQDLLKLWNLEMWHFDVHMLSYSQRLAEGLGFEDEMKMGGLAELQ